MSVYEFFRECEDRGMDEQEALEAYEDMKRCEAQNYSEWIAQREW